MKSLILLLFAVLSITIPALSQVTSPINVRLPKKVIGLGVADSDSGEVIFKWFPAKNAKEAAKIWSNGERWNFLNMASLTGTNSGGTASVDIVSDFGGPIRLALVGNVSASSDSSDKQKVERFLSGGGTAVLVANLLGPTLSWGSSSYILTSFVPKLGFDFPALGASTSTSTANLDLGIEIKINIPLENNNLGIFANMRGAYTMGGSEFYSQIGSTDDKAFAYGLLNAGITLPKLKMAVLFTRVVGGPAFIDSYNGNGRISLVISPK